VDEQIIEYSLSTYNAQPDPDYYALAFAKALSKKDWKAAIDEYFQNRIPFNKKQFKKRKHKWNVVETPVQNVADQYSIEQIVIKQLKDLITSFLNGKIELSDQSLDNIAKDRVFWLIQLEGDIEKAEIAWQLYAQHKKIIETYINDNVKDVPIHPVEKLECITMSIEGDDWKKVLIKIIEKRRFREKLRKKLKKKNMPDNNQPMMIAGVSFVVAGSINEPMSRRRFFKFAAVGAAATVVDLLNASPGRSEATLNHKGKDLELKMMNALLRISVFVF